MPNWCDNSVSVSHEDSEMMEKFAKAVEEGNLFETLVPLSSGEWDYGTACEEWGTKWDISDGNFDLAEDKLSGNGWFNTAWSPPIAAFKKLHELGFSIDALFHECGMGFAGTWCDGEETYVDDYYELFENEDWRDEIDSSDLIDLLESQYETWLESREEEEEEDGE
jgi:hypothetical protein